MGIFSDLSKKFKKTVGLLPEGSLEEGFDRRVPVIFPTRSPVNSLAGPPQETKVPPSEDFKPRYSGKFMENLIKDRENLNKIYSEGYFENHYPEADKNLKEFMHEKTMSTWAKALSDNEESGSENKEEKITLVININNG